MKDYLLSGLKVVDCATVIAAPAAAMMLADFGADVIKIERPGAGDDTRKFAPPFLKDGKGNRNPINGTKNICMKKGR